MKSLLTNISLKWRRWTSCFIPHLVFGIYFLETFYHDLWKLQRTKIETIILSSFWSQYNYNLFPSRVCRLPTEVWLVWARKSYKLYLYLNKIFCVNGWKNEKNEWKEWTKSGVITAAKVITMIKLLRVILYQLQQLSIWRKSLKIVYCSMTDVINVGLHHWVKYYIIKKYIFKVNNSSTRTTF